MDGASFDRVSRRLAGVASRRAAVAVVLAGLTGGAAIADAAAASRVCRTHAQKCVRDTQCCSGDCDTSRSTPRARRNRCACPAPRTVCGVDCIDLQTTFDHCGGCGDACSALADTCTGGSCACGDGDICDETRADNCTDGVCQCGNSPACSGFEYCFDGVCALPDCKVAPGSTACLVTTELTILQVYNDSQTNGPSPCSSSDECQAFRPSCATTETCICTVSFRLDSGIHGSWGGCHAYETWRLQP